MLKKHAKHGVYWFGVLLLAIGSAFANEIFRWTDDAGRTVFSDKPSPQAEVVSITPQSQRYRYQIKRIHDGDTLTLENGERVRFLSINTPEVAGRNQAAEPGGDLARDWVRVQLNHGQIYLEQDVETHDRYDRRLAYLWTPAGELLNEQLLKEGLATLTIMPPNLKYADRLIAAQQLAMQQRIGIWSEIDYPITNATSANATNYRGWRRWQIRPTKIRETRNFYYLSVNQNLSVRIEKASVDLFPPLEQYLNQTLEVHGWMSKQQDSFSIRVHHPSAIIVQ